MTDSERAIILDDYGPMTKTDLDILRNVLGQREMRQESGHARMMVDAWKAGRAAREMREKTYAAWLEAMIGGDQ